MRAAIPAGYMPAASGSGLLFELCPDGIPTEFIEFLTGGAAQHHPHAAHAGSGHHDHDGYGDHQCLVGHMLLSAAAVDDGLLSDTVPVSSPPAETGNRLYFDASRPGYRSRGPPA